ncbi:hypothetical protein LCGC14_0370270 [marine sediment metagenome]|uniref:Uncharacterized protein n=1 Tax=marine sediment metagenome TaxID=412755 RepID=A0A0F9WE47_9ZZZZ
MAEKVFDLKKFKQDMITKLKPPLTQPGARLDEVIAEAQKRKAAKQVRR